MGMLQFFRSLLDVHAAAAGSFAAGHALADGPPGTGNSSSSPLRCSALKPLPLKPVYVTLVPMGSKDKGRKEVKKAPKPKPKVEPGRKREVFAPAPPHK
jgi:hypothetical protein